MTMAKKSKIVRDRQRRELARRADHRRDLSP